MEHSTYPTPNTQHPTEDLSSASLGDFTISYEMSVAVRNPTGKVKAAQQAVADKFGCSIDKTTGGTYLLEQHHLKPLLDIEKDIRRFFKFHTDTLNGRSLIASGNYFRVHDYVTRAVTEFDQAKQDFLSIWETQVRPDSEKALRNNVDVNGESLYDRLTPGQRKWFSYSAGDMSQYYSFDFAENNVPSGTLKGVSQDIINGVRARIKEEEKRTIHQLNENLKGRLREVLSALQSKMKTYESGASRMHDSILGNISELVEVIPDMIVGSDPELVDLCADTKVLCSWDVELLKDNESARKEVGKTAGDILSKMSF